MQSTYLYTPFEQANIYSSWIIFGSVVKNIDFGWIDSDQNWVEDKVIYDWIYSYKSELNKNFEYKNQFSNQKLQFLASSKINSRGRINFTFEKPNKSE
jgi:hypothetical protein